ncbi:MAG TPA: hypothetical protein PKD49_00800 [Hyphomicrobium sp.]|nr:hypothetical protein [Hyphomicrobium sp.]
MKTISKAFIILGLAALGAGSATLGVRAGNEANGVTILGENKGASFDVGTKKAVAFYAKQSGACSVTVMVSETYSEQLPYHLASVRFTSNVAAGTTAQLDTADGAALSLACAPNASNLVVESVDRVAYVPPRMTN